jgi:hypothetical protein
MQEIYKDIKGYEGLYQISNLGNIRSLDRQSWNGNSWFTLKGKQLSPADNGKGYLFVGLCKNGKIRSRCYIHRLVAETFLPNPNNKPCVNHIDGNKQNNCLSNLEWVTYEENNKHAYKTGLKQPTKKTQKSVIATNLVTGEELYFDGIREAGRQLNIYHQSIQKICKGNTNRKSSHGYTFRYAE